MAPRNPRFAFFFMQNPPSAEVSRAEDFKPAPDMPRIDVGQERIVLKGKAKVEVKGRILRTGTQSAMRKLRVTRSGHEVHEEEVPGTDYLLSRYMEILRQKKARETNLAELDNLLYREGPQGTPAAEAPAPVRTPIKRSREILDDLQSKLDSLPCFKEHPGDVQLNECSPVFMNGALLHYYFKRFENPVKLFRKILKHLLPQQVLRHDGFSLEGKCDSVAIPEKLISAITAYVSTNTAAEADEFKPQTIVRSYVYNSRDEQYKRRSRAPRGEESEDNIVVASTAVGSAMTTTTPSASSSASHSAAVGGFQPRNPNWCGVQKTGGLPGGGNPFIVGHLQPQGVEGPTGYLPPPHGGSSPSGHLRPHGGGSLDMYYPNAAEALSSSLDTPTSPRATSTGHLGSTISDLVAFSVSGFYAPEPTLGMPQYSRVI